MTGGRRRALVDNALLASGLVALGAIAAGWVKTGRPARVEMIVWAVSTAVLMIILRVYQRVAAAQRDSLAVLNKLVRTMPDTRKCSACEFSADWFSVLIHEGAVHGL